MKSKIINIMAFALCAGLTACDDKLDAFELSGSTVAPTPITAAEVRSEALPGQIKLTWSTPAEGAYEYLRIWYNDPLTKEDVFLLASDNTTELTIDNTRARFGDYSIFFQTFNALHQGSAITEVKAQSGAAPASYTEETRTQVTLEASQLSTNAQEPTEGPIANLVNGNTGDFFHTRWSSPQIALPHYIQIDFNEEHEDFAIGYVNRNVSNSDGRVTVAELQISTDGSNWETVETLSGMPTASGAQYSSDYVMPGKKFKHFRFNVIATSSGSYFHLAEFMFYDVEVSIYDPETVPLD